FSPGAACHAGSFSTGSASIRMYFTPLPQKVTVSYSTNGKRYSQPEEVALPFNPTLKENDKPRVCILRHKIPGSGVKYIRIEAEPVEKLPAWHAAPGEKAWIMTDELRLR
ncbi:MAG: hypothetical protein K5846_01965, partial [Bacteroidales bacterium]|nr:hypothetical protein [Bacteroidales bacterium]